MTKHTILFMAANPLGTDRLALDEEARAIQAELERSSWREHFELVTRWAVQPLDLLRELRKLRPTIVHFSGHGGRSKRREPIPRADSHRDVAVETSAVDGNFEHGLFLQGSDGRPTLVPTTALEQTFGAAGAPVRLIVLNACYSEIQAEALLVHIDCVVGVSGLIRDDAARNFAIGFYGAVGERESVAAAYRQGCAALSLEGLLDDRRPRLKLRNGTDAEKLVLLAEDRPVQNGCEQGLPANESASLAEDRTSTLDERSGVPSAAFPLRGSKHPACPSFPVRADVGQESAKVVVVFRATMREFDAQVIARVLAELQSVTGDLTMQVLHVEEGSVRLTLRMANSAAQKLLQMQRDGTLDEICGFHINEVVKDTFGDREQDRDGQPEIIEENPIDSLRGAAERVEVKNAFVGPAGFSSSALEALPIFPLPNCVLLPGGLLPLHVFEQRYREMTRDCLAGHQLMGVARLRHGFESSYYGKPPVYQKCGIGRIICCEELPDGRFAILLRGVARAEIVRELPSEHTYRMVEARPLDDASHDPVAAFDHHRRLISLCDHLAEVIEQGGGQLRDLVRSFDSPGACADAVAAALVMDADARQELLEARDPMVRLQRTLGHVSHLLRDLASSGQQVS